MIARKSAAAPSVGFVAEDIAEHLFPHQRDLVAWSLRRGRAAIFADTGLGKGLMLLEWARQVSRHGRVIVLAPLAVGPQLEQEGKRFGVDARYLRTDDASQRIVITNYEILHAFDTSQFVGVVLDESSILKSYDGKTKVRLMDAFKRTPYRLCCTATPAPNDFTELGNHAEFLGLKTRTEMLAEYFVHDGGSTQDWRVKGHAVSPFWRWVASWGAVVKLPSDLGYDDGDFALPPLTMTEHVVAATDHDHRASGMLFAMEARSLQEQRAVRRGTIDSRVIKTLEIIDASCGSPNTQQTDDDGTPPIQSSESDASSKRSPTETHGADTCGTTTRRTSRSGTRQPTPDANSATANGASDTQRTPPSVSPPSPRRGRARRTHAESQHFAAPTASDTPTTSECSLSRAGAARSAGAPSTATDEDTGCTSTTATPPGASAASSARPATSESVDSRTASRSSSALRTTSAGSSPEQFIVWCELNDEQNALASALGARCVSIQGSTTSDDAERMLYQWIRGEVQVLVSKPAMFGFGLNLQNCHRVVFIGASHSYERTYQAIRRCWRFGQAQPVQVDLVRSALESAIVENYRRKEADAAKMATEMTAHVGDAVRAEVRGLAREFNPYQPTAPIAIPSWLGA